MEPQSVQPVILARHNKQIKTLNLATFEPATPGQGYLRLISHLESIPLLKLEVIKGNITL